MSYEHWKESIGPKVAGSWNLHECLPPDSDFFILLSSIAGVIGLRGQANYAAGNSFLDSLAHYRNAHGQNTVSLDLGAMMSEGLLAENAALRDRVLGSGNLIPISQETLFALLDYYCNPALDLSSPSYCQPIIGIQTPANVREKGFEEGYWLHAPLFRHLWQIESSAKSSGTPSEQGIDYKKQFRKAASLSEAGSAVTQAMVARLSKSLSTVQNEVDLATPTQSHGVDSLFAVELRSWFGKEFGADVLVFELMGGANFTGVRLAMARNSSLKQGSW